MCKIRTGEIILNKTGNPGTMKEKVDICYIIIILTVEWNTYLKQRTHKLIRKRKGKNIKGYLFTEEQMAYNTWKDI